MKENIICFGEIVWDALPMSMHLGGAPFNVAAHLTKQNALATMVSRVGNDMLGNEVIRNMEYLGMNTNLIQRDPDHNTGFVRVELKNEEPAYEIVNPSSWDYIAHSEKLQKAVNDASVLIFGTLSQRNSMTRETLTKLWESPCLKVIDVNLRPPHVTREHIDNSLYAADFVKLNVDELEHIKNWHSFSSVQETTVVELAQHFDCQSVCLTRGADGSLLYHKDEMISQEGIAVDVVDTIGAGDSFLATLIHGLINGVDARIAMQKAGNLSAFVASKSGAVPEYNSAMNEILIESELRDNKHV